MLHGPGKPRKAGSTQGWPGGTQGGAHKKACMIGVHTAGDMHKRLCHRKAWGLVPGKRTHRERAQQEVGLPQAGFRLCTLQSLCVERAQGSLSIVLLSP